MAEPISNVLGIVGMENKGEYSADAYYEKLNVVSYNGSSYCALTSVNNVLPTNTDFWQLIAEKGDKGDKGDTPVKGTDYYTDADKAELETDLSNDVQDEVTSQLGSLTSATPLVASSTAGMTDTSRIYVNTTDGHWYWYNGSAWTDGGVYQATAVADNAVSYNNVTPNLKATNYREIHAEDMIWFSDKGIYNGSLTNTAGAFLSQPFIMSKGSSITIDSELKMRITQWELDKTYIRNTGTYAVQTQPWIADRDCYVRIVVVRDDPVLTREEITNENIQVTGLVPISNADVVLDNLEYVRHESDLVVETKPIYCGKGTKVSINEFGFKNSGGTATGQMFNIGIAYSNEFGTSGTAPYSVEQVITKDGFIKIKLRIQKLNASGSDEILDSMLPNLKNIIELKLSQYNTISSTPNCYVSSNKEIKIVKNYNSNGSNLIRIQGLVVRNKSKIVAELSTSDIETQLSSYVVEYENENYIRVPAYQGIIYDLRAETLKMMSLNQQETPYVTDDVLCLALNAYAFFFGGVVIEQWSMQQLTKLDARIDNAVGTVFNSSTVPNNYDWQTKAKEFTAQFNSINSTNIESFLFFTDQHLMGSGTTFDEENLISHINRLQKMYNSTPTSFIVSGGDWLNNNDTQPQACFKLGYIDGFMNSMFKNYYPINGNHDTNYQGVLNPGEFWTGELSTNTQTNLSFRKYGKMYYKFEGNKSTNYVLDCVKENLAMPSYKWEQVDWLGNQLLEDNPEHATVMMHIVWAYTDATTQQLVLDNMANNVTKLLNAYNTRATITLNSVTYDFSDATGHVDYVLCGHMHQDLSDVINGILCVATINFRSGNTLNYDLIINDYDNHKLRMIRVGTGSNRTFDI